MNKNMSDEAFRICQLEEEVETLTNRQQSDVGLIRELVEAGTIVRTALIRERGYDEDSSPIEAIDAVIIKCKARLKEGRPC